MKNSLQAVSPSATILEHNLNELTGELPITVKGKSTTILTRHTLSSGIDVAFSWLEQHYATMRVATKRHDYSIHKAPAQNLIAEFPGALNPNKLVILGSHVDSRGFDADDAEERAPSADDNGTGTVAALFTGWALHWLQTIGIRPAYTVRIAHFSGEEQVLLGSKAYAASLTAEELANIEAMFQLEMLGFSPDNERRLEMYDGGDLNGSRALVDVVTSAEKAHNLGLTLIHRDRAYPNRPSDHFPFWKLGARAVCISNDTIDRPLNRHMHTNHDLVKYLNMEHFACATQLVIATVCRASKTALDTK